MYGVLQGRTHRQFGSSYSISVYDDTFISMCCLKGSKRTTESAVRYYVLDIESPITQTINALKIIIPSELTLHRYCPDPVVRG